MDENDVGWHIAVGRDVRVNAHPDDGMEVWLWEESGVRGVYSPHPHKGVRMNSHQTKRLQQAVASIDEAVEKLKLNEELDEKIPLGYELYASLGHGYLCLNLRTFYRKCWGEGVYPTRHGLALKLKEWGFLRDILQHMSLEETPSGDKNNSASDGTPPQ